MEQQETTNKKFGTYVNLPPSKYATFKKKANKKFKGEKGPIKMAITEAIKMWLKEN